MIQSRKPPTGIHSATAFLNRMNELEDLRNFGDCKIEAAGLRSENAALKAENQRLNRQLELALQSLGVGQKVSTVA